MKANNWQQQANNYYARGEYHKAAQAYEQAIAAEPTQISYYWHLGLMQLLQSQEVEAQTTWLEGMSVAESTLPDDISGMLDSKLAEWNSELAEVLISEATRQQETSALDTAWLLRRHVHEIDPDNINNLFQLVELSIRSRSLTESDFVELDVVNALRTCQRPETVNLDLLLRVLEQAFEYPPLYSSLTELIALYPPFIEGTEAIGFLTVVINGAVKLAYLGNQTRLAIEILELGLRLAPEELEILNHLAPLYQNIGEYEQGISAAKQCYELSHNLIDRIVANYLLLRGLIGSGGNWQEALAVLERHESLLLSLMQSNATKLDSVTTQRLYLTYSVAPYLIDRPTHLRTIQNQVSQLCQANVETYARQHIQRFQQYKVKLQPDRQLKIGYVSHCLRSHSVGWLARWLILHHDRDLFRIHGYLIADQQVEDSLRDWYVQQFDRAYRAGIDGPVSSLSVAEQIYEDEIDILIDLDSTTLDGTCEVMALKPAPIQATWLGWDASGIPTIDYFIADPYVLPDNAQDYYTEKIWRLPRTYIAVDGFEVAVPGLRRDLLEIPNDAVIYFSAQKGYKRHPDTVRLQMRILAAVPNSYFLVKGLSDQQAIRDSFLQIANEEGVTSDRLRFLPPTPSEAIHRANMGIADVILDTYPYNGATTTLEALWMCVPLVTRVGEQFFARYSYTMMTNAGIVEGIAHTDEEYVEWGTRLGCDPALRQQISWRLRQSRQTSPLWNGESFTRDMESAYRQMWLKYLEKQSLSN
ncbi:tetratricopeptide repeat protein [Pseudanabaena sp. PCC 6802]|uniref:O-linked N-acetylglucosamine transferase, SPINDLY family protein n=1 Tax=Pseudanabaena sp. PCC 6802 TaxID=118173 RepID=UPI00034AAC13|nr:tetratricopeptide repeat protein [Pseudanabaena sp. PCC 6802]